MVLIFNLYRLYMVEKSDLQLIMSLQSIISKPLTDALAHVVKSQPNSKWIGPILQYCNLRPTEICSYEIQPPYDLSSILSYHEDFRFFFEKRSEVTLYRAVTGQISLIITTATEEHVRSINGNELVRWMLYPVILGTTSNLIRHTMDDIDRPHVIDRKEAWCSIVKLLRSLQ